MKTMKTVKHTRIAFLWTALTALAIGGGAIAGGAEAQVMAERPNVSLPVTDLKFSSTGIFDPNGSGPLLAAPAFGDLSKGAHSTFIRMPAGFDGAVHTHTADFYVAVISGVGANRAVGGKDIPLAPGSYWFQPGGQAHVTKCISQTECVFFVTQPGKFDYLAVKR